MSDSQEALDIQAQAAALEQEYAKVITEARALGVTWSQLGVWQGTSRWTARRRHQRALAKAVEGDVSTKRA